MFRSNHTPKLSVVILFALLIATILAAAPRQATAQITRLCGSYTADITIPAFTTLTTDNCSVLIEAGVTMTIEEGVAIYFDNPNHNIFVKGALITNGTEGNPVTISSSAANVAPGQWGSISSDPASINPTLNMTHTTIQGGGSSGDSIGATVRVNTGSMATFKHIIMQQNYAGIFIRDSQLVLEDSVLQDNLGDGGPNFGYGLRLLNVNGTINPIIRNNVFNNNATFPMHLIFDDLTEEVKDQCVNLQGGMGPNTIVEGNRTHSTNGLLNGIMIEGCMRNATLSPNPNFPYLVWSLAVGAGDSLSIAPNTVIKFLEPPNDYAMTSRAPRRGTGSLIVYGTLNANGTATSPIHLTSYWDDSKGGDTNADGPSGGTNGDWRSLILREGATVNLIHTHVTYGGGSATATDSVTAGNAIDNCTLGAACSSASTLNMTHGSVTNSLGSGISGHGISQLDSILLSDNGNFGYTLGAFGNAALSRINNSTIMNNGAEGIYNNASTTVYLNARQNYWGSSSGPASNNLPCYDNNPDNEPTGNGDSINCYVLYRPFITAPPAPTSITMSVQNTSTFIASLYIVGVFWALAVATGGLLFVDGKQQRQLHNT